MEQKLKPCPFCGGEALHIMETPSMYNGDIIWIWYNIIHHPEIDCAISMLDRDKERLIERWNTRVEPKDKDNDNN